MNKNTFAVILDAEHPAFEVGQMIHFNDGVIGEIIKITKVAFEQGKVVLRGTYK